MTVRVICPDSHGSQIDQAAKKAFLKDLKALDPDELVFLGDQLDCSGIFNSHARNYSAELEECYIDDVDATNLFFDETSDASPRSKKRMIFGNHEAHIERWASRTFFHKKDADMFLDKMGPEHVLHLKQRGIQFYKPSETYMGIPIPGTIKLGRCFFTHGITASTHAAHAHLARFGANIVFGHVHRSQSVIRRTVTSGGIGAWCPGTLAKLQPLYRHTTPTDWTHGYAVQFVNKSGLFQHVNVAIVNGRSMLAESGLLRAA